MTSRKVSDSTFYPFIPARAETGSYDVMEAVKDLFIIVQGSPDASPGGGSDALVRLESVSYLAGDYTLGFVAYLGDDTWSFSFTFTENEGIVEVQAAHATVFAVMIVDSDAAMTFAGTPLEVEPARALWYTEQVDSITFANAKRLNGIEDPTVEVDVLALVADPIAFKLEEGHNTEWSVDSDGVLVLTVSEGIGLGRNEDLGDTVPGGDPLPGATGVVKVINGLRPVSGNIPILVGGTLGLETSPGLIEVVLKS